VVLWLFRGADDGNVQVEYQSVSRDRLLAPQQTQKATFALPSAAQRLRPRSLLQPALLGLLGPFAVTRGRAPLPPAPVLAETREEAATVSSGGLAMLASGGLLAVMEMDRRGKLSVQLLDYRNEDNEVVPPVDLVTSAQHVRAAWDDFHEDAHALVACYITGLPLDHQNQPKFVCTRAPKAWLLGDTGIEMIVPLLFMLPVLLCAGNALRQRRRLLGQPGGQQQRRGARRWPQAARRPARQANPQLTTALMASTASALDVARPARAAAEATSGRAPAAASPPVAAEAQASAGEEESEGEVRESDKCTICQEEVHVRAAFEPCGHMACRSCLQRFIDSRRHECHICRQPIENIFPVFT